MIIDITLKDPDRPYEAIEDAVKEDLKKIKDISDEEREALFDARRASITKICSAWIEYGEYIRIQIDTEKKTCVVLPVNK